MEDGDELRKSMDVAENSPAFGDFFFSTNVTGSSLALHPGQAGTYSTGARGKQSANRAKA